MAIVLEDFYIYLIWCFFIIINIHIAGLKQKSQFKWFWLSLFGPLATIVLMFLSSKTITLKDDKVFVYLTENLLKKRFGKPKTALLNKYIEEIHNQRFSDYELDKLLSFLNIEIEERKYRVTWFALTTSLTISFSAIILNVSEVDRFSALYYITLVIGFIIFVLFLKEIRLYKFKKMDTAYEAIKIIQKKKRQ